MRCPPAIDFLLGHRLARIILFGSTFYLLYLCVQDGDAGQVALFVLSLLLGCYGKRASTRVSQYVQWKRAWDQMADPAPAPTDTRPSPRRRAMRGALAVAAWAILGLCLLVSPLDSGDAKTLTAIFGLLTLRGAYVVLQSFVRRTRSGRKRKADATEFIVRVCPAIPSRSPPLAKISEGLPAYCKALMASRSAPP